MTLTTTDLFCGAGGSTSGMKAVPGVRVRTAANHWPLAVQTHNTNHPEVDHDCADISQVDPRRYPRTDILWASPECTNHSQAKGRRKNTADGQPDLFGQTLPDEAAERSRATMWDVVRFASHHVYRAIIVENVVDVLDWTYTDGPNGVLFREWLATMHGIGYDHQLVFLNSMHAQAMGAPAPQSRDRVYVVFWRTGDRAPDLNRWTRPRAYCPGCDAVVTAMQAWKRPDRPRGKYRSQYVWRCPNVTCRNTVVEPGYLPAAAAIDWALPGERIGDRARPLAAKTRARIAAGLAKYTRPIHLEAGGNQYDALDPTHPQYGDPHGYVRAWPADAEALKTLHTALTKGLAYAPGMLVPVEERDGKQAQGVGEPLRTQTARNETRLCVPPSVPPFVVHLKGSQPSQIANSHSPVTDPLHTFAAGGNHHALLMPYYGTGTTRPTNEPHRTFTTTDRYALVMRNNTAHGDQAQMITPTWEVLRTLTTARHQSLLRGAAPDVDECYFRMLEPHEIQAGMAFAREYVVLGNKRARVRQLGNAVTPPAARDLIAAVAEALGYDVTPDLTGRAA
jgi:DNA (cytosine-5)-methyltransferase 1